jgi:predicted ribosome quality control (RQC) complex YloA/Tae2 family protein
MLTLGELRRAARALELRIAGHRLQAVVQPDGFRIALTTYGGDPQGGSGVRQHVLLSCCPDLARVSLLARPPAAAPAPPAFTQYLRAHLVGARVGGVRLLGGDRQLAIRLRVSEGEFDLLLAILGRRSNVWLLDGESRLVAALRPLEETRPELALGEAWRPPASPPPGEGDDRFAEVPDGDFLKAIEGRYAPLERAGEHEALCQRIDRALRKEAKTRERKLEKLARELDEARGAARLERQGELLKGVLSRVRRGDREVVARDYETGEDVAIALDPTRSPAENLERIFKRYRKAVRGLAKAGAQRDAVRAAGGEIDRLAGEFRSLSERGGESVDEMRAFSERSAVRDLLKRYAPVSPGRPAQPRLPTEKKFGGRAVPGRLAPRRYRSEGGLEIWVGRSARGNDHLTTRLARGKDLFFHLDGAPGSHVVLRTEGRPDPPSESVLDACELAVHFSKFKGASRADVHVVPIKNVRKPKGAKPGLVTVHGGKTVHLRRIPGRLERILASQIDED